MEHRIIIDTDIGSDIDDAIALAFAMKRSDIKIEGVTAAYGNADLRAKLAKKLLMLGNRDDVKVYAGIDQPLLRNREVWVTGYEGVGVFDEDENLAYEAKHAVDFIIDTVLSAPNEITLVPIAPLTNIAAAMIREPKIIKQVKQIVLMGGVTRLGKNADKLDRYVEHNVTSDPEAAAVVFQSGAPITMVGLDVTTQVIIKKSVRDALIASNTPLNNAIVAMLDRWFDVIKKDFTLMHDPLTVAIIANRDLVKTKKMDISVQYDQRSGTGQTIGIPNDSGNVDVCLEVNSEAFIKLLLETLLNDANYRRESE